MARMDEAPTPDILYTETANASIVTPASGNQKLFVDTDQLLKLKNSSGTVTSLAGMSNPLTTTGDIIYSSSGTTAARLAIGAATTVLHGGTIPAYSAVVEGDLSTSDITTANATTSKHGFAPKYPNDATKYLDGTGAYTVPAGGGGGTAYGQEYVYPTSFGADGSGFTATTGWTDVGANAFTTFAIVNGTILDLGMTGASKVGKLRHVLSADQTGAFDWRFAIMPQFTYWSAAGDTTFEFVACDSSHNPLAAVRLYPLTRATGSWPHRPDFGNVGGYTTNDQHLIYSGESAICRLVRDGSGNVSFYLGKGQIPLSLTPVFTTADNSIKVQTGLTGTVHEIEFRMATPAGPSVNYAHVKIDWIESY